MQLRVAVTVAVAEAIAFAIMAVARAGIFCGNSWGCRIKISHVVIPSFLVFSMSPKDYHTLSKRLENHENQMNRR